jgi:tetratricopeptide (TPR) repeat protein
MTLGTLSDEAFQQRINEIAEARRAAEAEERASDAEQTSRFEGPAQRPGAGRQRRSGASSTIAADAANEESGFLFHRSPQRMQEGRRTFRRRWGTRNREPLWRIADITPDVGQVAAPTVTDAGQVQGEQGESEQDANAASNSSTEDAPETGSSEIDVDAVPRTEAEQEAMRDERTWAWYELGNALFLNINQPDSALTWYDRVLVEAPNHPVYERAVYARAEALEAAGRPGAAQAQYESLIRAHPESPFAERARVRIGQAAEPAPDSTQQTLQAYEAARHLADAGEWPEALRQLTDLAQTYRTDAVIGPRALWSMSRVYLKWHRRDSTAARQSLRRAVDTLGIAMDAPESDSTNASTTNASTTNASTTNASTTNASTTNASTTNASTTDASSRAERPQRAPMQQIDTPQADTLGLSEAEADSTASTPHIALRALLGHLQATFPDTPQAQRAQRLVQALEGSERAGDDDEVAPASNRPSRETPSPQGRLPTPRTSPEENR